MNNQETEQKFSLPSAPEDAEQAVVAMMKGGLLRPSFLDNLARARTETGSAASDVLKGGILEAQEKQFAFAEAVPMLREANFDLETARNDAVQLHEKWGLVSALRNKGIVQNSDQYGALFDNVTFTFSGLRELTRRLKAGEKWLPLFNPGNLTYKEIWQVLIEDGGIRFDEGANPYKNIDELRKIDPIDIPDLINLHGKSRDVQLEAFQAAYQKAPVLGPGTPNILFTQDQIEVEYTGNSSTQGAQKVRGGSNFIDPVSDLIRWKTQLENTAQHPDAKKWTQYPVYVFKNGKSADLIWNDFEDGGHLRLSSNFPDLKHGPLGPRSVLE